MTRLDSDVGRLLDLLKELKLDEKTLVFLAGDNGSSFAPESEIGRRFDQASNGLRGSTPPKPSGCARSSRR